MDLTRAITDEPRGDQAPGVDPASRAELVARLYPRVRVMVHRELAVDMRRGRPWLAALFSTGDVVHDVFLSVLGELDEFVGREEDLERYLARAVVHRLVDAIRYHEAARRDGRRLGRDLDRHSRELTSEDPSPTAAASQREEARTVEEALRALTPRDHALLELRLRRGLAYREIAAELGLPSEDAARKATRAAEARLLVALRHRGID